MSRALIGLGKPAGGVVVALEVGGAGEGLAPGVHEVAASAKVNTCARYLRGR